MTGPSAGRALARAVLPMMLALVGCAEHGPAIVVEDAWSRPTTADPGAAGRPDGPGVLYLDLSNGGDVADRLTGVRTPIADSAELHVTRNEGGRARMEKVAGMELPAGDEIHMVPGGHHVMLFGLMRQLRVGDRYPVVLDFERAGTIETEAEVRAP